MRKFVAFLIGGIAAATLTAAPASAVELVTNGGFETGDFSGWTVSGPTALIDTLEPHSGIYDALILAGDPTSLEQILATDAGQSYAISFWLRSDGSPPSVVDVSFGGSSLATLTAAPFGYTFFSYTATAPTASTTLSFTFDRLVGAFFFDDVTVQAVNGAVPEPATWAMMLMGFGAVGYGMRRRRRNGSLVAQIA